VALKIIGQARHQPGYAPINFSFITGKINVENIHF